MKPTTTSPSFTPEHVAHAIQITRHALNASADALPYDITERLRAARMQALAQVKKAHKPTVIHQATHEKSISDDLLGWLQRMPTLAKTLMAVPALCLAIVVAENTSTPNVSNTTQAVALMGNAAYAPTPVDTANALNIDAILKEQVPLQAYLNEDFNHFIDQDKQDNKQDKITPPQSSGTRHVQKNTIVQALR